MFEFDPKSLQHGDIEIREWIVVVAVEGEVLAVSEAAAGEDDWQVAVVVAAAMHVRFQQNHGALEQI